MGLVYQPATDLADRFLENRLIPRILATDITVWGAAAPFSAAAHPIANRLGWLDARRAWPPN
jgi:hypothetical protein